MRFSVKYLPTTLFSLKDSNSTNSGAKALFLPSPYAIKMAILNQAITIDGEFIDETRKKDNKQNFENLRDAKIEYYIPPQSKFCVNNSFVKILKPAREGGGFQQTVAFREYIYLSDFIEIIFEVETQAIKAFLKKYLHKINYFGKKGCFFQFLEYSDDPNDPNVFEFETINTAPIGILQQYDDFDEKTTFNKVNNYSTDPVKRMKRILVLPLKKSGSSKSFSLYEVAES